MEDARITRLVDDDGLVRYCATYTAYDGWHVAPQLVETSDFLTFRVTQLTGPAAKNKGWPCSPEGWAGGTWRSRATTASAPRSRRRTTSGAGATP